MALQKNGIDCGFVNIISKLPSHHVKGASIVLAAVVQELSRRKLGKCFNLFLTFFQYLAITLFARNLYTRAKVTKATPESNITHEYRKQII